MISLFVDTSVHFNSSATPYFEAKDGNTAAWLEIGGEVNSENPAIFDLHKATYFFPTPADRDLFLLKLKEKIDEHLAQADMGQDDIPCEICDGTGDEHAMNEECSNCGGKGHL